VKHTLLNNGSSRPQGCATKRMNDCFENIDIEGETGRSPADGNQNLTRASGPLAPTISFSCVITGAPVA
jgi:hypothetical protein